MSSRVSRVAIVSLLALLTAPAGAGAAPSVLAPASSAKPDTSAVPCDYLPTPPGLETSKNVGTPPMMPPAGVTSEVMTIKTNRGVLKIKLNTAAAPCTVNSFRFLASKKFFDGTHCHRLTTSGIYVLQCGDPFANGTANDGNGGPGYMYRDENLVGATYPAGTVAMANAGPHTNGSQFFFCYRNTSLQPMYTPFGTVDAATLAILKRVAEGGTDHGGDGHPRTSVVFKTLRVTAR